MSEPTRRAAVRFLEEHLPPHDTSHGTPHAVIRRSIEFDLPEGSARLEQTDYGHPGRLNTWEPREIEAKVQPRTARLLAAAEVISSLVDAGAG